jgi:hypothetical protein
MRKTISLDSLKQICEKYDKQFGKFPESEFEGNDVYEYVIDFLEEGKHEKKKSKTKSNG